MNKSLYFWLTMGLMMASGLSFADQVQIPHSFVSGTKVVAEEVNENFTALAEESNSHDQRINSLEFSTGVGTNIADRLFCSNNHGAGWVTIPERAWQEDCVQSSDLSNKRSLTFVEVMGEGWTPISFEEVYLFVKYKNN